MKTTIDNIIGMFAYTSDGKRIPAPTISGNPRPGATIDCIDGKWQVVGMDEAKEGC